MKIWLQKQRKTIENRNGELVQHLTVVFADTFLYELWNSEISGFVSWGWLKCVRSLFKCVWIWTHRVKEKNTCPVKKHSDKLKTTKSTKCLILGVCLSENNCLLKILFASKTHELKYIIPGIKDMYSSLLLDVINALTLGVNVRALGCQNTLRSLEIWCEGGWQSLMYLSGRCDISINRRGYNGPTLAVVGVSAFQPAFTKPEQSTALSTIVPQRKINEHCIVGTLCCSFMKVNFWL